MQNDTVGPRPSERADGKERRRGDTAESIVEEARRRQAPSQPAEARCSFCNALYDGENFNFGLVDIHDRPYEELTEAFRAIDAAAIHGRPARRRPDASGGVPPAPPQPLANLEPNLALGEWDRERGFVPPASRFPLADLYIAWSPEAVYLGLIALDPIEDAAYRGGEVPEADRMEWSISLGGRREPIRARLGAGRPAAGAPAAVEAISLSGKPLGVRTVAMLRVPARLLDRPALAAGDSIRLASTLTAHARAHRTAWEGAFRLDR